MTVPTTTPSEPGFYAALERLHGHRCPMSILGARLGDAARSALYGRGCEGHRLTARYHHRTCALDGIQLATGCTPGNGNFEVEPRGEHLLELRSQEKGIAVCARLAAGALDRGRAYAELRDRVSDLPPESGERRAAEERMAALLEGLETDPEAELVVFERTAS